jgi:hypothetical protein
VALTSATQIFTRALVKEEGTPSKLRGSTVELALWESLQIMLGVRAF